jgi:hypothetical protein
MRVGCRCVGLVLVLVVALAGCEPQRPDHARQRPVPEQPEEEQAVEPPDPVPGAVVGAVAGTSDIDGEPPYLARDRSVVAVPVAGEAELWAHDPPARFSEPPADDELDLSVIFDPERLEEVGGWWPRRVTGAGSSSRSMPVGTWCACTANVPTRWPSRDVSGWISRRGT